ncbi:hypothetical protein QF028_000188 [Neobacillus sp. B4I6]|uniref:hypothetical protein n=1 Tax=Neobacillus sp. B4I6 TaxID=3373925 RepID=UPI003D247D66
MVASTLIKATALYAISLYHLMDNLQICIRQLKNAINGSIFFVCKKSQNTQEMHKNLHILGSLILFLIVLKHPLAIHEAQKSALHHKE